MRTVYFQFIGIVMGLLLTISLFSQSVGINDDGSQPNTAAILDIKSSNKGLLIPRTDTTTINTLGTPTNGLIIYQTTDDVFYYFDGSRWRGLYTSDNAVFERDGTLIRQKGNVDDDDFILGKESIPANGETVTDHFLFFDQSKSAFRMGYLFNSLNWSLENVGSGSFAIGYNTIAKGHYSKAWGLETEASGYGSSAWGYYTIAPSEYETVFGQFNTEYTPNSADDWDENDCLFVIGNGTSNSNRSNALTIQKNGNTTLKGELTLTDGTSTYTLPNTDGSADQVLSTDGSGAVTWVDGDSKGVFQRDGNLIRQKGHVDNDNFIFGRDALPMNGESVLDTFFFFDQSKAAFRGGNLYNSSKWSPDSIGFGSNAFGYNTKAIGNYSTAWGVNTDAIGVASNASGHNTIAIGNQATAWGEYVKAIGIYSTAWGEGTEAKGLGSTAWGYITKAQSAYETVLGQYNTDYTPNSTSSWHIDDRLFVIGNGSFSERSNALTILKNGNTTLKGELTLTDGTSPYTLPNTDGTDDQVLSTDGSGAMSWTDRDDFGVFERDGTLIRQKGNVQTDNFIFGRSVLPNNGQFVLGQLLLFYKPKAAFRAIYLDYGTQCSYDSMGLASFAHGYNTLAKGGYSAAWGYKAKASADGSTAWGYNTIAPSYAETVLGRYNTEYSHYGISYWDSRDRLFVIGNGSYGARSNALTILKNGNTTLKGELTLTDGTSPYTLPNTDGTADQVLSTDGAGAMSWTDRDDFGVFERDGNLIRQKSNVDDDDFIFGRDALPANGEIVTDTFFFFDQTKAAFRGGNLYNSSNWSPDSIGLISFAFGDRTKAKGILSTAWGAGTHSLGMLSTSWGDNSRSIGESATAWGSFSRATGIQSTAWGNNTVASNSLSTTWGSSTKASGLNSTSWGYSSTAKGDYSTTWGYFAVAPSAFETALGHYNIQYQENSASEWDEEDRLFVIGNGTSNTSRSNALTILKNGNTTIKGELTLTDGTSSFTLPNTDGTTDQVLSTDGAGAVSWVDGASFGVFEREGSLIKQKNNISTDDLIFGRDALPINGESVTGKFLSFDKSKGSFRTGELNASSNWLPENSGIGSLAWGYNCKAKGDYSTAKGFDAWAIGYSSSAWGYLTNANKEYSTAWGGSTTANGNYSTAWGNHTHAESHLETVLGQYDTDYTPNSTSVWNDNDRLFVIGSGTSSSNRKNALTVLKNGCIGLQNFNTPTYALHLPNSSANDKGKGLAYAWTTYSDNRVKSKQTSLDYGLEDVLRLIPKSYFQHNSRWENEILVIDQYGGKETIGLIAQEVYDIIPEVVNKPEDEKVELWSMDYEKLVPVLINAIHEQQVIINRLDESLATQKLEKEKLSARLDEIEKILRNPSTAEQVNNLK